MSNHELQNKDEKIKHAQNRLFCLRQQYDKANKIVENLAQQQEQYQQKQNQRMILLAIVFVLGMLAAVWVLKTKYYETY